MKNIVAFVFVGLSEVSLALGSDFVDSLSQKAPPARIVTPQKKLDFARLTVPHIKVSYYFDKAADPITFLYLNQKQKLTWNEFQGDIVNKLVTHFQNNDVGKRLPFYKQEEGSYENLLICNTLIGHLPHEVSQLIERGFAFYALPTINDLKMISYEYMMCETCYLSGGYLELRDGKKEVRLDIFKLPKKSIFRR